MAADLTPLPISIQALLNPSQVESQRLEWKATWDDKIRGAVVETACAFANDLYNQNGGYIVLGVEQSPGGQLVLPPRGIDQLDLDRLKREIFGACKAITPDYQPMLFVETYQDKRLVILFCPGGDNRPYQAPNHRRPGQQAYFIRQDSVTTPAQDDTLRQLMEQASKIPWDDRRCIGANTLAISPTLVRRHLHLIGSRLAEAELPTDELYRKLRLVVPVNAHAEPRNVALLFFHDEPTEFFPGARIELCEFPEGRSGDRLVEHVFRGPLPDQLRACQNHLDGVLGSITQKLNTGIEARRTYPYPVRALQEVLVNAVYHRGYESPEPTKVYLEPDCITITSYPGPHPRILAEQFRPGHKVPEVPARNRRIGELLKELKLAEARGSGILKIQAALAQNGSPPAEVDCDASFFSVRVPIHEEFAISNALSLRLAGHDYAFLETIQRACSRQPTSLRLVCYGVALSLADKNEKVGRAILTDYILAAKSEVHAEPILIFAYYLMTGRPDILYRPYLESHAVARVHAELSAILPKIQVFEDDSLKLAAVYCYWSLGELGEALALAGEVKTLSDEIPFVLWTAVMTAGIRLELAAQHPREIAEQLLGETEALLSDIATEYSGRAGLHLGSYDFGRIYLRLAQVRQALGVPAREVTAALRQARQLAEVNDDKEALAYLDRHFRTKTAR